MIFHIIKDWKKTSNTFTFSFGLNKQNPERAIIKQLKNETLPPTHEATSKQELKSIKFIGTQKRYASKKTPQSKRTQTVREKGEGAREVLRLKWGSWSNGPVPVIQIKSRGETEERRELFGSFSYFFSLSLSLLVKLSQYKKIRKETWSWVNTKMEPLLSLWCFKRLHCVGMKNKIIFLLGYCRKIRNIEQSTMAPLGWA